MTQRARSPQGRAPGVGGGEKVKARSYLESETCGMVAGFGRIVKKIIERFSDCSNEGRGFERLRGS